MERMLGWSFVATTVILAAVAIHFFVPDAPPTDAPADFKADASSEKHSNMVAITGGQFVMGSHAGIGHEQPPHRVSVDSFSLAAFETTNSQFEAFVEDTGYQTTAELTGFGHVLNLQTGVAGPVQGADWRHPSGLDSEIVGRGNLPVVQISWRDALAYAEWAGLRLPTEAEWEYAARAGLLNQVYPWGTQELVNGRHQANYWQGRFPDTESPNDGFAQLAEIGRFAANRRGIHDMAGNVREWTNDRYANDYYQISPLKNPLGPISGDQRVARGGSWASTTDQIVVWARTALSHGYSDNMTGFRCAR